MTDQQSSIKVVHYPVMEHFATIQGEGRHSGTPAYFVRLGGCDVGCHWCDVKDSWPMEGYQLMTAKDISDLVVASGLDKAVITGGEPLIHNLDTLCKSLHHDNIQCHMETSGAHPLSGQWDWITFSPKKFKAPLPETVNAASELKVIVFNHSDFEFAETWAKEVSHDCLLYLQPEWSKREKITPVIVDYIKKNPKWRISLQTHKYINVP